MQDIQSTPGENEEIDYRDVDAGRTWFSRTLPFLPIHDHRLWRLIDVLGLNGIPRRASSMIILATLRVSCESARKHQRLRKGYCANVHPDHNAACPRTDRAQANGAAAPLADTRRSVLTPEQASAAHKAVDIVTRLPTVWACSDRSSGAIVQRCVVHR